MILGKIDNQSKYYKDNKQSEHLRERQVRLSLCLIDSKLLHTFKVFYEKTGEIQVHCLYSDASLYIHDSETGEIVTVILSDRARLGEYLKHANEHIHDNLITHKCAKLHELIKVNENDSPIKKQALENKRKLNGTYDYIKRKKTILMRKQKRGKRVGE